MRVAGLATIQGRENEVLKTIESLYNQVDNIHVYCNYENSSIKGDKIKVYTIDYAGDLGDSGKFFNVPKNCIYYACDDDLIYPSNYCDYLEYKVKQYGCPVSLHGKIISPPVNSYYKSGIKFRCLDTVDSDIEVNVIGTGTLAFDTSQIKISVKDFEVKNMADIWFSIAAKKQGVRLVVAEHQKGYLTYQQVKDTIYDRHKNNDAYQTQIVNSLLQQT